MNKMVNMISKNKNKIIIGLIVIIALFIILFLIFKNETKVIECNSLDNKMKIEFRNNKAYYVEGYMEIAEIPEKMKEEFYKNVQSYSNVMRVSNNKLKYAMIFNQDNSAPLSYIGLNINDDLRYKSLLKTLEQSNYSCK